MRAPIVALRPGIHVKGCQRERPSELGVDHVEDARPLLSQVIAGSHTSKSQVTETTRANPSARVVSIPPGSPAIATATPHPGSDWLSDTAARSSATHHSGTALPGMPDAGTPGAYPSTEP